MLNPRAGSWSRQQRRRAQLDFVKEHWALLLSVIATATALMAAGIALSPARYRGFLSGLSVSTLFWMLLGVVGDLTGSATYSLGSQGEELTSAALRKLRRRGWHVFDHVPIVNEDVDHILVGPGGVYAIESKNTSRRWELDKPDLWMSAAVDQARRAAGRVHALLLEREIAIKIDPPPLLVLWGKVRGDRAEIDGVRVVLGPEIHRWRTTLGEGVLSSDEVQRIAAGLQRYVAMRDARIREGPDAQPLLVTVGPFALLSRVATGLLGGMAFLVVFAAVAQSTQSEPRVLLYVVIGALTGAVLARFVPRLRLFAIGWTTAAGALVFEVIGLLVVHHLA